MAARARAEHGTRRRSARCTRRSAGRSSRTGTPRGGGRRSSRAFVEPILAAAGLPSDLADALDDESWDAEIQAETDEALALTGKDVGTPILHFRPPEGVAFFGPVISRLPGDEDAVELWDHVARARRVPGLRRAQAQPARAPPAARVRRRAPGRLGIEEDWHGGSRRLKR